MDTFPPVIHAHLVDDDSQCSCCQQDREDGPGNSDAWEQQRGVRSQEAGIGGGEPIGEGPCLQWDVRRRGERKWVRHSSMQRAPCGIECAC